MNAFYFATRSANALSLTPFLTTTTNTTSHFFLASLLRAHARSSQLIASADANLAKIRKYEDYLTSKASRSCSEFLMGDLSRFGDSHEAMEMVTYAQSRNEHEQPEAWGER